MSNNQKASPKEPKSAHVNPSKVSFQASFNQVRTSVESRPRELRGPFTKSINFGR